MKKTLFLIFLFIIFISCKTKIPYSEEMKIELKEMYKKDQKAQEYDLTKVHRKEYSDSMEIEFNKLCERNLKVVKKYFTNNGFPGIRENGKETSLYFWLIAQHADNDIGFQKKVLSAMKKELKSNNVNKQNFAYLYDRVKKNQDKPQLYGTQMIWDSQGRHSTYKLKFPKKVNQLRAEMELEPIEEYIKKFNH
jgi:hypothetical protein